MMANKSCRHSSIRIEATATPSASARGASRKTGQPVLILRSVRLLVRTPTVITGMPACLEDRHRRFDRFGAEEADDDADLGGDEIVRRLGAAFGRALVVDDFERGRRAHRRRSRLRAGADLRAEPRRRAGQRRRDADQQLVGSGARGSQRDRCRNRRARCNPRQARHGRSRRLAGGEIVIDRRGKGCRLHRQHAIWRAAAAPGLWRAGLVPYKARQGISGIIASVEEARGRAAALPRRDGAFRRRGACR